MPSTALLKSIGAWRLSGYFDDLDTVKEFGLRDMSRATDIILEMHADVNDSEAKAIAKAWSETFDELLSAERRAMLAIESENA